MKQLNLCVSAEAREEQGARRSGGNETQLCSDVLYKSSLEISKYV